MAAALVACSGGAPDAQRWSALPHTMGCRFLSNDSAVDPPGSTVVKQVTLSHKGGSRLELEALFRYRVPPEPRVQNGRFGPIDAPGSIYTQFLIHPHGLPEEKVIEVSSPSPSVTQGWSGDVSEFDNADPEILASVSADDNRLTIVLDLDGQDAVFGSGPFKADVDVVQMVAGQPDAAGGSNLFPVKSPRCDWDTPTATSAATAPADTQPTATFPSASPQEPSSIPAPGADAHGFLDQPGARCDDADTVEVAARTTQSALVICRNASELVYRGSRLSDGASIELLNAVPNDGGFDVVNPQNGTRYEVRSSALTIRVNGRDFIEPVTEFWSAAATALPSPDYSAEQLVRTASGQVRCQVESGEVVCERASIDGFPQAPTSGTGGHWNLATITSGGEFHWNIGNLGGVDPDTDIVLDYGSTRRINGWMIEASNEGTRFINDGSGHGMFVSISDVDPF
ncbi:hypothetical protein D8S82_32515 [Mycobacterium hodleri]|uniref:Uncharacterized protein n=1 Tax=Mycolicibacterium hodleri TaxID=49897 RepID=A0A544VQU9_9MYCO|nr:hypothetical protein [Mycolicibacterium hodleri]TQR82361.1 hypothetical protein D8S82_32515 [Mycolicibacterium hodleri]